MNSSLQVACPDTIVIGHTQKEERLSQLVSFIGIHFFKLINQVFFVLSLLSRTIHLP